MSRMDLNGDINSKAQGLRYEATSEAGPDPIDLPNKIIEFSYNP